MKPLSSYEWSNGDVRARFGFQTGFFPGESVCSDKWAVTSVVPGGYFDRAGVQLGDIPVYYVFRDADGEHKWKMFHHGLDAVRMIFYKGLKHPRGSASGFVFIPCGLPDQAALASQRTILLFPQEAAVSSKERE